MLKHILISKSVHNIWASAATQFIHLPCENQNNAKVKENREKERKNLTVTDFGLHAN